MARTIEQGFTELLANLEVSEPQATTLAERQRGVREALSRGLDLVDDFLIGSYRRKTMIAPLNEADVDVFVVLGEKYFAPKGQGILLQFVRRLLRQTYPRSKMGPNGQAVTIGFSDFGMDVVPAFQRPEGGYIIPDVQRRRWIPTDPKVHVELWSEDNERHGGKLVPLIKIIKAWNRQHDKRFRSFHLEALVRDIVSSLSISDYPATVSYFFGRAQERVPLPLQDPAGYGSDLGDYMRGIQLQAAMKRVRTALKLCADAPKLAREGKTAAAFGRWRALFGNCFPRYG